MVGPDYQSKPGCVFSIHCPLAWWISGKEALLSHKYDKVFTQICFFVVDFLGSLLSFLLGLKQQPVNDFENRHVKLKLFWYILRRQLDLLSSSLQKASDIHDFSVLNRRPCAVCLRIARVLFPPFLKAVSSRV